MEWQRLTEQPKPNAGRMQGKRKPHSLLAGVQIGAATVEIHVENSQTAKNKHIVCLVITLLHICPKYSTSYSMDTRSAMFTNALFTIVKKWKQSKCPTTDGWVMERWYTYIVGIFFFLFCCKEK